MGKQLLSLTNDYVFRKIFSENEDLLKNLLENILHYAEGSIEHIEILDSHLHAETEEGKLCILNIRVKIKDDPFIDIEMQVLKNDGFFKRILYYLSDMYVKQLKKSKGYSELKNAISIVITNYVALEGTDDFHNTYYMLHSENFTKYPDGFEIHILELPKLDKDKSDIQSREWMKLFKAKEEGDYMQAAESSPYIAKAYEILKRISGDENVRLAAEARERLLNDMVDNYKTGERKGREEGIEIGVKRGREEGIKEGVKEGIKIGIEKEGDRKNRTIIANMLKEGLSLELISRYIGINLDMVKKYAGQIQ